MRSYTIEVTGAKYVHAVIYVEASDNPGAIIQADAIIEAEFDWDETHSRHIIATSNIALPEPIDADDIMGEIEEGYNFEPEGADLPTPGDLVDELVDLVEGEDVPAPVDIAEVDAFIDEDGETVVVEREDISDEIEGGVSVEAYEEGGN